MSMKQRGELCFFLSKHCVSLPCKLPIFIFHCYLPILNSDLAVVKYFRKFGPYCA